jgi:hypothetical protein
VSEQLNVEALDVLEYQDGQVVAKIKLRGEQCDLFREISS